MEAGGTELFKELGREFSQRSVCNASMRIWLQSYGGKYGDSVLAIPGKLDSSLKHAVQTAYMSKVDGS